MLKRSRMRKTACLVLLVAPLFFVAVTQSISLTQLPPSPTPPPIDWSKLDPILRQRAGLLTGRSRIVLRAPWKKMTITPIDISVKTRFTSEMKATISKANTPITQYLDKYSLPGYMWDEIAGAALIDPSIITGQKEVYVDIDVDHGPSYGETLFWQPGTELPSYERRATVQFDVDTKKLYDLYIRLMTKPAHRVQ